MPKHRWTVGLFTCLMSGSSQKDGIGLISAAWREGKKQKNAKNSAAVVPFVTGKGLFCTALHTHR